jgi:hypothetical protein
MSQLSNNFYNQPDAMREAKRIASDRGATVYLVQDQETPGKPWSVRATAPTDQPSAPVKPE